MGDPGPHAPRLGWLAPICAASGRTVPWRHDVRRPPSLVRPIPRRVVGLSLGAPDADERSGADPHAGVRQPPDGDAVGGRRSPAQRDAELRGAAGGKDDAVVGAGRLPAARHDRHLRARLVGGIRLAGRDRAGDRVPPHQRDERPPADLRLGPGCARCARPGRQGLGPGRHDARRLAPGGDREPAVGTRRDRCGPRRADHLPAVLGVPDAGRDVPARRGGVAPAARRPGTPGAGAPRRDRGGPIAEPDRGAALPAPPMLPPTTAGATRPFRHDPAGYAVLAHSLGGAPMRWRTSSRNDRASSRTSPVAGSAIRRRWPTRSAPTQADRRPRPRTGPDAGEW